MFFSNKKAVQIAEDILRLTGREVPAATPATLHGKDAEDERLGWNIDALTAAAEYGRTVTFSYDKGSGVLETRTIIPERLDTTRAGKQIVQGEDTDRDDTRVFRLDRIAGHVSVR